MKNNFYRLKKTFCVLSLAYSFVLMLSGAEDPKLPPNVRNFAPGEFFPGHLQGIAADESGIYWSCYDRILKTGWDGKILASVRTPRHAGDCCLKDGKLYVSTTFYDRKEIVEAKGIRAALYIFDCGTLRLEKRVLLPDIPFPDGITWYGDELYLADQSVNKEHFLNQFFIYDRDLKFQRREVIEVGVPTRFGAQALSVWNGKLLACFYAKRGRPSSYLLEPGTLKVVGTFPLGGSIGLAAVPESVAGRPDVFCRGRLAGKVGAYYAQADFFFLENGKARPFPVQSLKVKKT